MGDLTATDPRNIMTLTRQANSSLFGSTVNPVAEEIRSPQNEKLFYQGWPVIPFLHNGEVTIQLLRKLSRLSPTHSGCIQSISGFVTGGQFDVQRKKRKGFRSQSVNMDPITPDEFNGFADFVEASYGQPLNEVHQEAELFGLNYIQYGNAYLEIRLAPAGGGKYLLFVYNQDVDRVLYLATDEDEERIALISPHWYDANRLEGKVDPISVYPNFTEDEDGVIRTLVHVKNAVEGRAWYGLPSSLAGTYHAYGEIQRGQYGVEGYANDFTGRVFLETFDNAAYGSLDPDYSSDAEGYQENPFDYGYQVQDLTFDMRLQMLFTNKGRFKRRIMHRSAPAEAQKSNIHEFKANTDEKYHIGMAGLDEDKIVMSWNWDAALMGKKTAGKLGKSQEFTDALKVKYYQVVQPIKDKLIEPFNIALGILADKNSDGEALDLTRSYSLSFANIYRKMLEETKDGATNSDEETRSEEDDELEDQIKTDTLNPGGNE